MSVSAVHFTRPSLQDIRRSSPSVPLVGRDQFLSTFERNIRLSVDDDLKKRIIIIQGQGGVGKSALMRQFREIAFSNGCDSALCVLQTDDMLNVMLSICNQLDIDKTQFAQCRAELERRGRGTSDSPERRKRIGGAVARGMLRTGSALSGGVGLLSTLIGEETVVAAAGNITEALAGDRSSYDLNPYILELERVTYYFLDGLWAYSHNRPTILFFDEIEYAQPFFNAWIRILLDSNSGSFPPEVIICMSGRRVATDVDWMDFRDITLICNLEPLSISHAKELVEAFGVTDPDITTTILKYSLGLPVLISMLSHSRPTSNSELSDPSDTAVQLFLRQIPESQLREAILRASIPRFMNRDITAVCHRGMSSVDYFDLIRGLDFVEVRSSQWIMHDVVRSQLSRSLHAVSPNTWRSVHEHLIAFYRSAFNLPDGSLPENFSLLIKSPDFVEYCYHSTCAESKDEMPIIINALAFALVRDFAGMLGILGAVMRGIEDLNTSYVPENLRLFMDVEYAIANLSADGWIGLVTTLIESDFLWESTMDHLLVASGRVHAVRESAGLAFDSISRVSEHRRHEPDCLFVLGLAHLASNNVADAIDVLSLAIERDSTNVSYWYTRARCYRAQRDYDYASLDLHSALRHGLNPLLYGEARMEMDLIRGSVQSVMNTFAFLRDAQSGESLVRSALSEITEATDDSEPIDLHNQGIDEVIFQFHFEFESLHPHRTTQIIERMLELLTRAKIEYYGICDEVEKQVNAIVPILDHLPLKGLMHAYIGNYDEAMRIYSLMEDTPSNRMIRSYNIAAASCASKTPAMSEHEVGDARLVLEGELQLDPSMKAYGIAGMEAMHGRDSAFALLREAMELSDECAIWARLDPAWIPLRSDVRFRRMLFV